MKILMVIAKEEFRDEEFKEPYDVFKNNNINVDIASTKEGECIGKYGMKVNANKSFNDINVDEYLAIVLVGGPGSKKLVANKKLISVIKSFVDKELIVSAICFAPIILAKAGFLKGIKSTVWNQDGLQVPIFEKCAVKYVDENVVKDEKFITARDYTAAKQFGETIVTAIMHFLR